MSEDIPDFAKDLHPNDQSRVYRYERDLDRGLKLLRTFSQGVTVYGSARLSENSKYYRLARSLGQRLAQTGHTVITGGGPGIMEAANRGAYEYGGRSVGLNITLMHEQHPNPYLTEMLQFDYFFARRVILTMSGKVYAFFPGGFGTMDEFTEVVLLMQEGKMPKMPVFLIGKKYWKGLDRFYASKMTEMKLIRPVDRKIYRITDDIEEVVAAAEKIGHIKVDESYYDKFGRAATFYKDGDTFSLKEKN